MYCTTCGAANSSSARFCATCGGALANQGPGTPAGSTLGPGHAQPHSLSFDLGRLTQKDIVVGASSLALFVTLFLPWYSIGYGFFGTTFTLDALWQGWMYLVLFLSLATVVYLALRAVMPTLRLPIAHWQALAGACGLTLLLTVLGVFVTPAGTGHSWAGFVGLLAAIVAFAAAVARRNEPEESGVQNMAVISLGTSPYPAPGAGVPVTPPTAWVPPTSDVGPAPSPTSPEAPATHRSDAPPSSAPTESRAEGAGQPDRGPLGAVDGPAVAVAAGTCTGCGGQNPPASKFCRSCGQSLS